MKNELARSGGLFSHEETTSGGMLQRDSLNKVVSDMEVSRHRLLAGSSLAAKSSMSSELAGARFESDTIKWFHV